MESDSSAIITVDGAKIVYHTIGNGPPLVVLSGFAATSADWDPSFIDRLASSNKLLLVNNRGIGGSMDDGGSFDITKLAEDTVCVIETLGIECANVMGWSMGGFILQALALKHPNRVDKLVLLSTDPGGIEVDLASPAVRSELIDISGTPNEQAQRLLFLLFPKDVAESFYRQFGEIVAAARAQLSIDLLKRQAAAIDAWYREPTPAIPRAGTGWRRNGGHRNSSFKCLEACKRNSWRMACSVPSRRPCLHGAVSRCARRSDQQFSRS